MVKKYTHAYILTFSKSIIPTEVKNEYCLEKVPQYIPCSKGTLSVINRDITGKGAEDI